MSGVCGGIAEYFGISPLAVRLIFILLTGALILSNRWLIVLSHYTKQTVQEFSKGCRVGHIQLY
ncbi:PspC domain-containing protein [Salirhabdus euzebyi]|uniref:PspC domain-containing protein n=1 Tax=Salirhabdus euzebyi TaxID=394506 RepID=UPI00157A5C36|nr:PspC domain-containing protein [Salirhabdus euzebyi]